MTIYTQSTKVQQSFGEVMEQAMLGEDVVVERYGAPRVVLLSFERYQQLLKAEKELPRLKLRRAAALAEARAAYLTDDEVEELIEQAREEVHNEQACE